MLKILINSNNLNNSNNSLAGNKLLIPCKNTTKEFLTKIITLIFSLILLNNRFLPIIPNNSHNSNIDSIQNNINLLNTIISNNKLILKDLNIRDNSNNNNNNRCKVETLSFSQIKLMRIPLIIIKVDHKYHSNLHLNKDTSINSHSNFIEHLLHKVHNRYLNNKVVINSQWRIFSNREIHNKYNPVHNIKITINNNLVNIIIDL